MEAEGEGVGEGTRGLGDIIRGEEAGTGQALNR